MYSLTIQLLLTTQVYSQLIVQWILLLLHVSAAYCSHLQRDTSVRNMHSLLCRLSSMYCKILVHICVIP